ncbi:hypothetical protein RclHR1_15270002 [Rhizophagus clarus]|uniref:Uncharacterized protein n=1 Tax=Rhizophagus clarus TaxID=94130 RepID=A0A2Z6QVH7_9GLOM|nr:hypothetical protein RclHR1_15270002 [Rhizophagus clarus]GES74644.1 hypothetical protein GLOIN_2v1771106 [Rhizophagus clarus]
MDTIADNKIDKRVHSTRLGVSYDVTIRKFNQFDDVTIRKFNQFDKATQDTLRSEGKYFKLYKNLQFDVHSSAKQLKRWNRVTRRVYHLANSNTDVDRQGYTPVLTSTDPNDIVIKTIHHLSWKKFSKMKLRNKHLPPSSPHKTPSSSFSGNLSSPATTRSQNQDVRYTFTNSFCSIRQ